MAGFSSGKTKIYTTYRYGGVGRDDPRYAEVGPTIRKGGISSRHLADVYVSRLGPVARTTQAVATYMGSVASSVLAAHHNQSEGTSANPRIEVRQGDMTDWYVLLVVGPKGATPGNTESDKSKWTKDDHKAMQAALAIEFGGKGGRGNVGPLISALAAVLG